MSDYLDRENQPPGENLVRRLEPAARREGPPPLPPQMPAGQKPKSAKLHPGLVGAIAGLCLLGVIILVGVGGSKMFERVQHAWNTAKSSLVKPGAMAAARKPVLTDSHTLTAADLAKVNREFVCRQFLTGYELRGERNPECDALARGLVSNWIARNYSGTEDRNLPELSELSDQLANDPACTDPLVLTGVALNTAELREKTRLLERAVKGFETSKHLGYPKFFATLALAQKLADDKSGRLPVLDAQTLTRLQEAFTDGSLRPTDQARIADLLIEGSGSGFSDRNATALDSMIRDQGDAYKWLALVLEGTHEISAAWKARGGGYRNTVSDAGWKGFKEHLANARAVLTQAWKLRPDLPLAPCRMMYVSLGDAGIDEMRLWFDRTVAAQIDYAPAWKEMRWGLRPRWYGDVHSMLAFGETALNTRRFDTDVPRTYFDSVTDVAAELNLPQGQSTYGREDIWPHLQELYEGYISEPSVTGTSKEGWRSSYAVVAFLAGKYDVARNQLVALDWHPHPVNLTRWGVDLTLMPQEVAARSGSEAEKVKTAESMRQNNDLTAALKIYSGLAASTTADELTRAFAKERLASLGIEERLQSGEWADFLPTDTNLTGWHVSRGKCERLPDGALEVRSDKSGHMLYSRARIGAELEVRGEFEVMSSTTKAFQAGLVMGLPQFEGYTWDAFRVKRSSNERDGASFSQQWTTRQIYAQVDLESRINSFIFRFHDGRVSATVNGHEVFKDVEPPKNSYLPTNELGLGAFNNLNSTVIRYRNLQVRKLVSK